MHAPRLPIGFPAGPTRSSLLLMLTISPHARAQQQATLSGIISDPSGAVVPDTAIRVTNNATQVTRTAVTNATGYYLVLNLTPGTYSIVAQKEGFKTATQTGITLQVAQSATVDLRLELGQTSQEVTVSGAAPLLQTTESTIGQVIGPTTMVEMPLNGRNYFNLAELAPGVTSYGSRSFYSSAINDYGTSFNSGSGGEDRNGFSLDGADIKGYVINDSYVPSIDSVQEFKIETTPYSADLGTSSGAQILLVTKSGTDQFHGSAYEFLRNNAFDAYNYFDDRSQPIPKLIKNQFGGTIGGPILSSVSFSLAAMKGRENALVRPFSAQCRRLRCGTEISLSGLSLSITPLPRLRAELARLGYNASPSSTIKFRPASSARFPLGTSSLSFRCQRVRNCQQLCRKRRGSQHTRPDNYAHRRSSGEGRTSAASAITTPGCM